jgi:hypothetical protein
MNDLTASSKLLLSEQDSKLIGEKSLSLIKKKESKRKKTQKQNTRRNNKTDHKPKSVPLSRNTQENTEEGTVTTTRRVIPDAAFQVEKERNLRKIATRGVVLLFNQIAQTAGSST